MVMFWSGHFTFFFFQKKSQILLGGSLEEHCWDNVLVAVVLLNFRPPTIPSSCPQYHAVAHSALQSRQGAPRQPGSYFRNEDFCFRASPRNLGSSSLQYTSLKITGLSIGIEVFITIVVTSMLNLILSTSSSADLPLIKN